MKQILKSENQSFKVTAIGKNAKWPTGKYYGKVFIQVGRKSEAGRT